MVLSPVQATSSPQSQELGQDGARAHKSGEIKFNCDGNFVTATVQ